MNYQNPSEHIKALRKAGNFQAAIERGKAYINDFYVLIQINWAYYGLIKQQVAEIIAKLEQAPPNYAKIKQIYDTAREYAKLPNRRADSSLSNILRELTKLSAYSPDYLNFIYWVVRIDGIQDDDWQAGEYQGKQFSPLVCSIARGLAKWVSHFSQQATSADVEHIIGWLENTRSVAVGDDVLWLDWDRVKLLKQLGKHQEAAQTLGYLLKNKNKEFWLWQKAGQLYASEQPDLAKACFCQALQCCQKPEFSVNVHIDLAQLLAEQNETAWANGEVLQTRNIREQHGWKIGDALQKLLDADWYSPENALSNEELIKQYQQYAPEALVLCFDDVQEYDANFDTVFTLPLPADAPKNKNPKKLAKFIFRPNEKGKAISIVGTETKEVAYFQSGTPVCLLIGKAANGRQTILHISSRENGQLWDCADKRNGVVENLKNNKIGIFFNRNSYVSASMGAWQGDLPNIGDNVLAYTAYNQKKETQEILLAQAQIDVFLKNEDIKIISGCLKRHEKGFAFVEDVFVAPYLLQDFDDESELQVEIIAIYSKNPKKSEFSWRAIKIKTK